MERLLPCPLADDVWRIDFVSQNALTFLPLLVLNSSVSQLFCIYFSIYLKTKLFFSLQIWSLFLGITWELWQWVSPIVRYVNLNYSFNFRYSKDFAKWMIFSAAGSDVVSMKCKADRVDGGYVINGNKMWCTNGPVAETLVWFFKIHFIFLCSLNCDLVCV